MAKEQKVPLKKGKSYFTLVGTAKVNEYTFTIDKESTSSDYIYSRMNLGIDCGGGNVVYSEMMGGFFPNGSSKIYAHGKKVDGKDDFQNQLILDWDERNNKELIKEIGDQCFIRVGLERDVKENIVTNRFLSSYDAIEFIQENLVNGAFISVSGSLEYSVYDSETTIKKKITSIYFSKQSESNPPKAKFTQSFLLDKNFLSKVDTEKNSISAKAYVVEYVNKINGSDVKKNLLLPKTFDFDLNKISQENVSKFIQMFLKFKTGYLLEIVVDGEFREGVSTIATTFEDLDNDSKAFIQFGMLEVDDALAKRAVTGSREKRMIFTKPHQIESVTKNEDGSEVVTKSVVIVPEKYTENSVEYYSDYSETTQKAYEANDAQEGLTIDDESMDFLKSLT